MERGESYGTSTSKIIFTSKLASYHLLQWPKLESLSEHDYPIALHILWLAS